MHDLQRHLAPITPAAWSEIEQEATRALKTALAARKLVDFTGPLGWEHAAVSLGRVAPIDGAPEGVEAGLRQLQPLVELCVPFSLERRELEAIDRGAADPALAPVTEAARALARAEDRIVFDGWKAAQIRGLQADAEHEALPLPAEASELPATIARAVQRLREASVNGPYAAAFGPDVYAALAGTVLGSHTVLHVIEGMLGGAPVVWTPGLSGGVVLSLRGGDFELVVGRDISIGYRDHDRDRVHLYLSESLTFRLLGPEAIVPLARAGAA